MRALKRIKPNPSQELAYKCQDLCSDILITAGQCESGTLDEEYENHIEGILSKIERGHYSLFDLEDWIPELQDLLSDVGGELEYYQKEQFTINNRQNLRDRYAN